MCTSVSADQRSEALGARNAGECRLAQDGLEKDDAVFGVEDCHGDQGEDEESGERAAEHFEEPGPLVERELRRDICNIVEIIPHEDQNEYTRDEDEVAVERPMRRRAVDEPDDQTNPGPAR